MALTKGEKSKYAKKLRRKAGQGRVDPRWMWWFERGVKPLAAAVNIPRQETEARQGGTDE